jgi:DNA-binding XRE family transcriptional regulator
MTISVRPPSPSGSPVSRWPDFEANGFGNAISATVPGRLRRPLQKHYAALAAVLRAAREDAGLTQRELAAHIGVSKNAVDRAETGERRVDVAELFLWADALGVTPETIIRRIRKSLRR